MSRKNTIPEGDAQDNGLVNADDAREPEAATDTSFDPANFEQPAPPAPAVPYPFDPASLRLSQDFAASLGVKKALLTVPVRKPDKAWFVRVHPDEAYRLQTAVIELKEDRGGETHLVAKALWPDLAAEA